MSGLDYERMTEVWGPAVTSAVTSESKVAIVVTPEPELEEQSGSAMRWALERLDAIGVDPANITILLPWHILISSANAEAASRALESKVSPRKVIAHRPGSRCVGFGGLRWGTALELNEALRDVQAVLLLGDINSEEGTLLELLLPGLASHHTMQGIKANPSRGDLDKVRRLLPPLVACAWYMGSPVAQSGKP